MAILTDANLPFGTLNSLTVNQFAPGKADLDIKRYSFLSTMKNIVKDRFTPDVFNGVTEYKAIVLKNLNADELGLSNLAASLGIDTGGTVRFIGKIPELHACLPSPRGENDIDVLSMYPIFEGAISLGVPEIGDVVRVTYQNIFKQSVPIYLGPVAGAGNIKGVGYTESTSAKNSFKNNQYNNTAPNNPDVAVQHNGTIPKDTNSTVGWNSYPIKEPITQIIIHESITSNAASTIRSLQHPVDKNHNPVTPTYGVHFLVERNGSVISGVPLDRVCIHADGAGTTHNNRSIGIETINPVEGRFKGPNDRVILPTPSWIVASGGYVIPKEPQCNAIWLKILELTSNIPEGVPADKWQIKLQFPAHVNTSNGIEFIWDKVGGLDKANGIMAHAHWLPHSDGLFIEHYCVCRYLNYPSKEAYDLTFEHASNTPKNRRTLIQKYSEFKEKTALLKKQLQNKTGFSAFSPLSNLNK